MDTVDKSLCRQQNGVAVKMTPDVAEQIDGYTEELADGQLTIEYEPIGDGQIRLAAYLNGDVLESGEYPSNVFGDRTQRGTFLNSVEKSLEGRDGVEPTELRKELNIWFAEMHELDREESEKLLPVEVREIIEGTHTPVEIHGGETTTWKVTLTYAGRTNELEFSSGEIVGHNGGVLEEKIANQFYELIEVGKEDWKAIRERWDEKAEVVNVVEETAKDAIADRVIEKLRTAVMPVAERDDLENDDAAAWYDPSNTKVIEDAPPDAAIIWVQNPFLADQIEAAGKTLEYKSDLVGDLIDRGDLYGPGRRYRWAGPERTRMYPFDPEPLGVTEKDVGTSGEPNHGEVGA